MTGAVAKVIGLRDEDKLPDEDRAFVGAFVVRPGVVVHAFTKEDLQRKGVMTTALADYGFDFLDPTPVLIWSAVASRIAAGGHYRIYPAIPEVRRP